MFRVCQYQLQHYKTSSRVFYCQLLTLQICQSLRAACSQMRCSVVFGATLRLVINISSSCPAINTDTYYQHRCIITCETVAVVHRRPCLQYLACCSVNTGSQARYRLKIAISAYPTCIRRPRQAGVPSEYCYAVWREKKLEWRGYPMVKKFEAMFIRFDMINCDENASLPLI